MVCAIFRCDRTSIYQVNTIFLYSNLYPLPVGKTGAVKGNVVIYNWSLREIRWPALICRRIFDSKHCFSSSCSPTCVFLQFFNWLCSVVLYSLDLISTLCLHWILWYTNSATTLWQLINVDNIPITFYQNQTDKSQIIELIAIIDINRIFKVPTIMDGVTSWQDNHQHNSSP